MVSTIPTIDTTGAPSCRICSKEIAKSVAVVTKFSMVICKCDRQWCHNNCADNLLNSGVCFAGMYLHILHRETVICSMSLRSNIIKVTLFDVIAPHTLHGKNHPEVLTFPHWLVFLLYNHVSLLSLVVYPPKRITFPSVPAAAAAHTTTTTTTTTKVIIHCIF